MTAARKKLPSEAKAVWEKKNPVREHKHLTEAQKTEAKARARRAGRKYPNMVDNMAVLHTKRKKKS